MNFPTDVWPLVLAVLATAIAGVASAHAILRKRDVRAAIGWVGLIWLAPFVGSALYGLFGINRISRRASELRLQQRRPPLPGGHTARSRSVLATALPASARHLSAIGDLVDSLSSSPLTLGNTIIPLVGGADAYRAMLGAIDAAAHTVGLSTYIFDNDRAGDLFLEALRRAVRRGVQARVLIDGVGVRYSYPPATVKLRRAGIAVAEFLPTFVPLQMAYANLRNHRKILVVDGRVGFVGGMNIREGHLHASDHAHAVQDIHFRIEGPVVAHLVETFVEDWAFCTRELLSGPGWFPELLPVGATVARGIAAGPDEDFERIRWTILGALSQAKERIRVVTPYFLPDHMLMTSLLLALMRGVEIDVLMPQRNNLRLVQWASCAKLPDLLVRGCRIWQTPAPFDHSKLMTVDGLWSFVGSANWDPRSLRLNFEFNVECYGADLATAIDALIDAKRETSRPLTLRRLSDRGLAIKLRDGAAWLLSPYL